MNRLRSHLGARRTKVAYVALLTAIVLVVLMVPQTANAGTGASGVVAVHNGRWGYQEIVFGKATTYQVSNWAPIPLLQKAVQRAGIWALPLGVGAWTIQYRAQQAVRSGECFALVRPGWYLPLYFAAKTSWGCR